MLLNRCITKVLSALLALACSTTDHGAQKEREAGAVTDASGAGGADGGVGTGGMPGVAGVTGMGGDEPCCPDPLCGEDEHVVREPVRCASGPDCQPAASPVCCNVYCATKVAGCELPSCDPEDIPTHSCPAGVPCYAREECSAILHCLDRLPDGGPAPIEAGVCNPSSEWHREYVGRNINECNRLYNCPDDTVVFDNPCGCGCEQHIACPKSVVCTSAVGGDAGSSPLCADRTVCPYTQRVD